MGNRMMRLLVTLAISLTCSLAASAAPPPGAPGTPEHARAGELVKQLGDARFATREAAAKKLFEMGPAALPALQDGTKSGDEEVRDRCTALIPKVKAAEQNRRADAYVADVESKQKHDLPLLAEFEKAVGKPDAAARKLFAEMVRTNGELLELAATDPKRGKEAQLSRAKTLLDQLRQQPKPTKIDVADLAAVLLVDSATGAEPGPGAEATIQLLYWFNETVGKIGKDVGPEVRRLVVRWADVRWGLFKDPRYREVANGFFHVIFQAPYPEIVPVLVKIARSREAGPWAMAAMRVMALMDGKEAAAALEKIMLDKSLTFKAIGRDHRTRELRLGDYALAFSLQKHNRKFTDFGLKGQEWLGWSNAGEEASGYDFLEFASEEARTKAIQKWKEEVIGKK
jgi:hypothetical protein